MLCPADEWLFAEPLQIIPIQAPTDSDFESLGEGVGNHVGGPPFAISTTVATGLDVVSSLSETAAAPEGFGAG